MKTDSSIYNYIDDSFDDEDDDFKPKATNTNNKAKLDSTNQTSPRQQQAKKQSQEQPLNLVASSQLASQKKKQAPTTNGSLAPKTASAELDATLAQLQVDEFESQQSTLIAIFSNDSLLVQQDLATYLNAKCNHIGELDAAVYVEKEAAYPANRLDKKLHKYLSAQVAGLGADACEKLFDYCFAQLFVDSSKLLSTHGFKIYIQLIVKQMPNILTNKLSKVQMSEEEKSVEQQKPLINVRLSLYLVI